MPNERTNGGEPPATNGAGDTPDSVASSEGAQIAETPARPVDPIAQLTKERDELKDRLLRTAADYDNFRKRARKDVEDAGRSARESLLRDFLPVIDNLERALSAASQGGQNDVASLAKGVELVLKLFADTLGRFGVRSF